MLKTCEPVHEIFHVHAHFHVMPQSYAAKDHKYFKEFFYARKKNKSNSFYHTNETGLTPFLIIPRREERNIYVYYLNTDSFTI